MYTYWLKKQIIYHSHLKDQSLNNPCHTDLWCSLIENISSLDDVSHDSVSQLLILLSSQLDGL